MNATAQKASILVERTYPAPVSELWELWATKDGFESWWGPEGFRVEVHALEPKENGLLHYSMIADSPQMIEAMKRGGQPTSHEVRARFSAFSPQKALTITSVIDFLPGVEAYESNIEVLFTPLAHGAHMAVTLHAMHDAQFTEMQKAGFTSQLGKLDRRYAK
ncbi:SRPBCC family protein [Sorangium sp. So ce388]|uniref:Activator of Hsp90 ATPase 1 family protein n=1 Tax=Sorangium cellulosum TaxID=56 RepID=A0A150RR70_SORCE|nr:activator of Hsp90 ATPase 1 family protein [Sorangium cellulosum]